MRQALHIFRKDIRYLYREIILMLGFTALLPWAGNVLAVIALYLISRLIHAEAIPGDRQFWLTRPYRWTSLLGAKLLFIVAFINIPIGLAQLASLMRSGFPVQHDLPGLLWSQVLIFSGSLTVVALSAITSGLVPFILSSLTLLTVIVVKEFAAPRAGANFVDVWPVSIEWIRNSVLGLMVTAIAVCAILVQYKRRETARVSAGAVIALALTATMVFLMPVDWALKVQSWLSINPSLGHAINGSIGRIHLALEREKPDSPNRNVRIVVPLRITGVPEGIHAIADGLVIRLEWTDGKAWKSGFMGVNPVQDRVFDGTFTLPQALFRANLNSPLTVRAGLYLTLFGTAERTVIPLQTRPVNAQDGLRCVQVNYPQAGLSGAEFRNLYCGSFFRWPARLVYANSGKADMDFNNLISYSPWPATLSLNPSESYSAGLLSSATSATIITKEPLAHFRRDFEVHGLRLAEFSIDRPPNPR